MNSPDFTGERFIPGQGGAQIAYEHLHRYWYALGFATGKRVLDVAAGAGYGAALLATAAQNVWAVDRDEASVRYARRTYGCENLLFVQGDATSLPLSSRCVDVVVAMEVLEHVEHQEQLVGELARVVAPGGVVLISTPNKAVYSDARDYRNPFHVHELYREEFMDLLGRHFDMIQIVEQQVRAGSLILNPAAGAGASKIIAQAAGDAPAAAPMYFLALCGAGRRGVKIPAASAYLDTGNALLIEWEDKLRTAGVEVERLNAAVQELGKWSRDLEGDLEVRNATIQGLQDEMAQEISQRDQEIGSLQERMAQAISQRDWEIGSLQERMAQEIAHRDRTCEVLQAEFAERSRWADELQNEIVARDAILATSRADWDRLKSEFDARGTWAETLRADLDARDRTLHALQAEMAQEIARRDQAYEQLQAEFTNRGRWAQELERDIAARDARLKQVGEELGRMAAHLERIQGRHAYRILARIGVLPQ